MKDEHISTVVSANAGLDVRFGSSAPINPHEGTVWINHGTNVAMVFTGGLWVVRGEALMNGSIVADRTPAAPAKPTEPVRHDRPATTEDAW